MPCPTCDHTMQNIGTDQIRQFWCPRCGTITGPFAYGEAQAPALVERCRKIEETIQKVSAVRWVREEWHSLGIAEAIHKPEDRP